MNKLGLLAAAAQFAPRLFQVRRSTWIGLGIGFVVMAGLFIWAAIALLGWFLGLAQGWVGGFKEAASAPAQAMLAQSEQLAPGVVAPLRAQLGEYVPGLKAEGHPLRDVSGTDVGPVPRYPGLLRSYWHREGRQVVVEYEGKADYSAVLEHYARGFASRGFAQSVQSASLEAESHAYTKAGERYLLKVAQHPGGRVSAHLETTLP